MEDVEGSLPPKVSMVLKCKNSAFQAAVYDWIKATGTIRLDPDDESMRVVGTTRQTRIYANLNNKVGQDSTVSVFLRMSFAVWVETTPRLRPYALKEF